MSCVGYTDGVPFLGADETPEIVKKLLTKPDRMLGMTYGYMANQGEIRTPLAKLSQSLMYELGNNWVCLAVANYQETFHSTIIRADHMKTLTDRDIEWFVNDAHSRGIKVCLKPMVNSEDEVWRAHIGFPDLNMDNLDIYWTKWFQSYLDFMLHYATLAEELGIELFCIGCEMLATEHRKYQWLYVIEQVRKVYSGKLIYNTNHDHEDVCEWFDVLDYIGTSAYYPVGKYGTDAAAMKKEWNEIRWRLNAISDSRGKPYVFMEIGCRSELGCSGYPYDFEDWKTDKSKWSEDEQATFYETCLDVFLNEPRFAGVFWWEWPVTQYHTRAEAEKDIGYNIHLKKAEQIVKDRYKNYQKPIY